MEFLIGAAYIEISQTTDHLSLLFLSGGLVDEVTWAVQSSNSNA